MFLRVVFTRYIRLLSFLVWVQNKKGLLDRHLMTIYISCPEEGEKNYKIPNKYIYTSKPKATYKRHNRY